MKINVCKTPQGLVPWGECDYDNFKRLKEGDCYSVEVKLNRNQRFHDKYMKLVRFAWEYLASSQKEFFRNNFDVFRKTMEISAGNCEKVYSLDRQEWIEVPKSVSFNAMSEEEFQDLYERMKDVLFTTVFKDMDLDFFLTQLAEF